MSVQYKWEIISLKTIPNLNGLNNVVKEVNWKFQAVEVPHLAEIFRTTQLSDPDTNSYIQYDSLTDETVIDWVKNSVDEDELKNQLNDILENSKQNVLVEKAVPWNTRVFDGLEEYLMVIGDQKLGPFKWNVDTWNELLSDNGESYRFPKNSHNIRMSLISSNTPFTISSIAKLYRVQHNHNIEIDDNYQSRRGYIYDFSTGIAIITDGVVDKTVEELKQFVASSIESTYNTKAVKKVFVKINSDYISFTDEVHRFESSLVLLTKLAIMSDTDTIVWRSSQGNISLTKTEVLNVLKDIDNYREECIEWKENLIQQLENINSSEDIIQLYENNILLEE
jgi:hypothetical protein